MAGLFSRRRIRRKVPVQRRLGQRWVGTKVTSDVTVAITGVAATTAVGTVAPATTVAVTGNAATAAVGTVAPSTSVAVTGSAATSAVGTVAPSTTVGVTGTAATGAAGTVSVGGDVTLAITGVAATTAVGTVAPSTSVAVTGTAATSALGTVSPATSVAITGNAASGETGLVSVIVGGDITVSITGVEASGAVGSVGVTGADVQNTGGHYWPTIKAKKRKRGKDRADELREEAAELRAQIERAVRGEPVTVPPPAEIIAAPAVSASLAAPRPTLRAPVLVSLSAEVLALRAELAAAIRLQHETRVRAKIDRLEADIERAAFAAADAIERALERRLKRLTTK